MTDLLVYEELKDTKSIIDLVAKNTNTSFAILKIYGSTEIPLYSAHEIAQLIEIKNIDRELKHFGPRECVYAKVRDANGSEKAMKLLTEHGLYRIMFINRTPVGEVFREFVYMVLDKLKSQRIVQLENVQDDMKKHFAAEIANATQYLQTKVQNLESEIMANGKHMRRNVALLHEKEQEAAQLSYAAQQLGTKVSVLEERLLRAELHDAQPLESDEALLEYLKDKYMKVKLYVYLMPCKDDSDYNYNHMDYDIMNLPDENDMMYFRLSRNNSCIKGRMIKELAFEHESQLIEFKDAMINESMHNTTPLSNDTYFCELAIINEFYVTARSKPIVEKKNKRRQEILSILSQDQFHKLFN